MLGQGRYHRYALALAIFVIQLGRQSVESFGLNFLRSSTRAVKRSTFSRCGNKQGQHQSATSTPSQNLVLHAATDTAPEKERPRRKNPRLLKLRIRRVLRRRARRLARLRRTKKDTERQTKLVGTLAVSARNSSNVNDVDEKGSDHVSAGIPRAGNDSYIAPRGDIRTAATAAADVERAGQTAVSLAATAAVVESTIAGALPINDTVNETIGRTSTHKKSKIRKRKHSTKAKHASAKRRRSIKDGDRRGLWKSIFGPRPLRDVESVDELCRLVDNEGWKLEDLSVFTWDGGSAPMDCAGGDNLADPRSIDDTRSSSGAGVSLAAGDSSMKDGSPAPDTTMHPTVQAVLDRAASGTTPSGHGDGRRIGLAIEGGGMRGCVAAGMASCLHFLGLADSFDGVYGASAGSLVGAYFVSRQSNGTAVYHDVLPSAGSRFIDMSQFPKALGFELPRKAIAINGDARDSTGSAEAKADALAARFARVIGLDFLLEDVVARVHSLDFERFLANDKMQPLHVVTSGVKSMSSVSLASRRGHFKTRDELGRCIRASMLVPGLAGPVISVPTGQLAESAWRDEFSTPLGSAVRDGQERMTGRGADLGGEREVAQQAKPSRGSSRFWGQRRRKGPMRSTREAIVREEGGHVEATSITGTGRAAQESTAIDDKLEPEVFIDAMVFEPLPYRSAIEDGCTDVVVLCTRPKTSQVLGKKPSIYETRVVKKYFESHQNPETDAISAYLQELRHLRIYAEDALVLREGSRTGSPQQAPRGGPGEGREAFVLAVAPGCSSKEVGQLDMDRRNILQGCRDGFAACYDTFVRPMTTTTATSEGTSGEVVNATRARSGAEVALEYFPDSILSSKADLDGSFFQPGRFIVDQVAARATMQETTDKDGQGVLEDERGYRGRERDADDLRGGG